MRMLSATILHDALKINGMMSSYEDYSQFGKK